MGRPRKRKLEKLKTEWREATGLCMTCLQPFYGQEAQDGTWFKADPNTGNPHECPPPKGERKGTP